MWPFARTANNSLFPPDVQISRLKIVHDAIVRSLCNRSVAGVGKLEEMHCLPPGKETLRRLIVNPGCDSSAENVSQKTINPITDDPVEAS